MDEEKTRKTDKLKRSDDVFKMLLVVMSTTTSFGLTTYSGIDLWRTIGYFLASISFWMVAHLGATSSRFYHEIDFKVYAWFLALLVTTATFTKFWLKASILDSTAKLCVVLITWILACFVINWFGELVPARERRRFYIMIGGILLAITAGYVPI